MSVSSYALTTLGSVKTYLGISDSSRDTLLESLINSASALVEKYTGRYFVVRAAIAELHDGEAGCENIKLKYYPVTAVASVKVDGVTADASLYSVDKEAGLVRMSGGWSRGEQNVEVVYSAGMAAATADVPGDLQLACQMLVSLFFNRRDASVERQTLGDYSISYAANERGLPLTVAAMLERYTGRSL